MQMIQDLEMHGFWLEVMQNKNEKKSLAMLHQICPYCILLKIENILFPIKNPTLALKTGRHSLIFQIYRSLYPWSFLLLIKKK